MYTKNKTHQGNSTSILKSLSFYLRSNMNKYLRDCITLIFLSSLLIGNIEGKLKSLPEFQVSSERYVTMEGNIMMYVNIWGEVKNPGRHLVYDGIDIATLLSIVGGPETSANMKKVKLYRELPDEANQMVYNLNLEKFIKTGDRSNFIEIKPNDTIQISSTLFSKFLNQVSTINTLLSLLNFYFIASANL